MATENPIRMSEDDGSKKWPSTVDPALIASAFNNISGHEGFTKVLNECGVLREQIHMVPNRSGSAPPTIEGSIASLQAFIDQKNSTSTGPRSSGELLDGESEEQMRMDPGYIAYYYANVNLNPRLPPPILSRENRHLVRLMGHFGSKKVTSQNESILATHREEPEEDMSGEQSLGDQLGRSVTEKKKASLAFHNRGPVDAKQGDLPGIPSPAPGNLIKGENDPDNRTLSTDQAIEMQASCSGSIDVHEDGHTVDYHGVASVSCNDSPGITLEDNVSTQSNDGSSISVAESRMKSLNVSGGSVMEDHQKRHENVNSFDKNSLPCHLLQKTMNQVPGFQGHFFHQGMPGLHNVQPFVHNPGPAPPLYAATSAFMNSRNPLYPGLQPPGLLHPRFSLGGLSPGSVVHPSYYGGYLPNSAFPAPIHAYSALAFSKHPIEATSEIYSYMSHRMLRPSFSGPLPGQFLQQPFDNVQRSMVRSQLTGRDGVQNQFDVHASQKDSDPFSGNLNISAPTNESRMSFHYYGHPPTLGMAHIPAPCPVLQPLSPMAESNHPGPGNDLIASQHSPKNVVACSVGSGQRGSDSSDDSKRNSFLELLKSCNSRKLELSDISGQIVEFSTDQHGSRFIQQKLEYCNVDEKESVFREVFPHASKLMIDVFGNYVIQKFFEHGTAEHRKKLGEQLTGQIVTLSLQMYGCRVIQKALEVIELDQKVKLVQELDGNVMRCVHDQNGNHVIQKCIESVPIESIRFIISSFSGEVATLSSHPYGCRVIQRVLEHCSDEQISLQIIDEILESACSLAQDPYGNYVTQHVLEMGRPQQRSQIISKLIGKFVQLSQHKYASNVVEKCLKYGDASEQNLIIEEMVVQSDDVLLTMMKDQFANYVLQKIFDICTDKQRDILLSCVRTHLPTLKKFPYAKHIVARYEQISEGSLQENER